MQHRFLSRHVSLSLFTSAILVIVGGVASAADPAKPGTAPQSTPAAASTTTTTKPVAAKPAKPAAKKPKPVDLNSASAEQLKAVPGVDDARAEKIIQNRPYPTRAYLVTKGVYAQDEYYKIKDHFVAAQPASPKAAPKK